MVNFHSSWKLINLTLLKYNCQKVLRDIFRFQTPSKPNKTNMIDDRKHKPSKGLPRLIDATTFNDLSEILRIRSNRYPTNYMDLLLLENKNRDLSGILALFEKCRRETHPDFKDFKDVPRIKSHIRFRKKNDGWVFDSTGNIEDPVVKLIGLKGKP